MYYTFFLFYYNSIRPTILILYNLILLRSYKHIAFSEFMTNNFNPAYYMHRLTASLRMRDGLISAQVTASSGDECWDQPISPYPTMQYTCIFLYEYLSETANWTVIWTVNRIWESASWTDLSIRLVLKANTMSARISKPQNQEHATELTLSLLAVNTL